MRRGRELGEKKEKSRGEGGGGGGGGGVRSKPVRVGGRERGVVG